MKSTLASDAFYPYKQMLNMLHLSMCQICYILAGAEIIFYYQMQLLQIQENQLLLIHLSFSHIIIRFWPSFMHLLNLLQLLKWITKISWLTDSMILFYNMSQFQREGAIIYNFLRK